MCLLRSPAAATSAHPTCLQASQLRSLALRCSHPSVYAATESMESLSKLTALSSLRMGHNPEDIFPHSSPLGFPRLPSFLGALSRLQHIDISMADSATVASLSGLDFAPIRHVPDVKLTLRADTSIRAVAHLPASISCITGLSELTVQVGVGVGWAHAAMRPEVQYSKRLGSRPACLNFFVCVFVCGACTGAADFAEVHYAIVPC